MAGIPNLTQILVPRKRMNPKGVASTSTFNPTQADTTLSIPLYRDHLKDIFTTRQSQDARKIMKDLFKFDSDASATVNAYLTIADTTPRFYVYDMEGTLDREGQKMLNKIVKGLTSRRDYSDGFKFTESLSAMSESLRYMILLRGACAAELIFDKFLLPAELRHLDPAELTWSEKQAGKYKPQQEPSGSSQKISMDIPNFFVKYYRQNPNDIYPHSPFVSAINTIAARQQVINDLYRIMQKTGYPRMDVSIMEEVLLNNAPEDVKLETDKQAAWVRARINEIRTDLSNLRSDSAYVHTDAVKADILNEGGPRQSMDVKAVIEVLNAQNQAALKTMATIIGRGESGVNTASVEARVFSLSAQSINNPIADLYSDAFTLALRLQGFSGYVECKFDPVEMRPQLELEAHKVMRQSRLLKELSLGIISDDEYHIHMHNRPRPDNAPELSGTGFDNSGASVDTESISPNSDPLGRSLTPDDSESARSNTVKGD